MLAQNFMAAEALGITEEQHETLVKVLGIFERGEADGQFLMEQRWPRDIIKCSAAVCLVGWCDTVNPKAFENDWPDESYLGELFFPAHMRNVMACTDPAKGAHALRNYLTTGDPDWAGVMASAS